jgi:hypothetical protein
MQRKRNREMRRAIRTSAAAASAGLPAQSQRAVGAGPVTMPSNASTRAVNTSGTLQSILRVWIRQVLESDNPRVMNLLSADRPKHSFMVTQGQETLRAWHEVKLARLADQLSYQHSNSAPWAPEEVTLLRQCVTSNGLPSKLSGSRDPFDLSAVDCSAIRRRATLLSRTDDEIRSRLHQESLAADPVLTPRIELFYDLRSRLLPEIIKWGIDLGLGGPPVLVNGQVRDASSREEACGMGNASYIDMSPDLTQLLVHRIALLFQSPMADLSRNGPARDLAIVLADKTGFPPWWQVRLLSSPFRFCV